MEEGKDKLSDMNADEQPHPAQEERTAEVIHDREGTLKFFASQLFVIGRKICAGVSYAEAGIRQA